MPARVAGSFASQSWDISSAPRSLSFGGALTPGSLLVATFAMYGAGITVSSVADGDNLGWADALAGGVQGPSGDPGSIQQWFFANNGSSGTPTVTVTPSGSAYISLCIEEYTGVETVSPIRTSHSGTGNATGTAPTGTILATDGDLIVAGVNFSGGSPLSVDVPFTLGATFTAGGITQGLATAYHVLAGQENCIFNAVTTFGPWSAVGVAYKAASAGAGGAVLVKN